LPTRTLPGGRLLSIVQPASRNGNQPLFEGLGGSASRHLLGQAGTERARERRLRLLVTGTAGFVGFHLAKRLPADGHEVLGIDGMTPYYDVKLKEARHQLLKTFPTFSAHVLMLEDAPALRDAATRFEPEIVVHLAAQAGVRYSLENPRAYVDANV